MILMRISGHSGAGKSRLLEAVIHENQFLLQQAVLYTSRPPRQGEIHGKHYYFGSRSALEALPHKDFFIGHVHSMVQALDLNQLELDLQTSAAVVLIASDQFWPEIVERMRSRLGNSLRFLSVGLTAVDPKELLALPSAARPAFVKETIERILVLRSQNQLPDIEERATSAVREVLDAFSSPPSGQYDLLLVSAPEGPDGEDEWTRCDRPVGQAMVALNQFRRFLVASGVSA